MIYSYYYTHTDRPKDLVTIYNNSTNKFLKNIVEIDEEYKAKINQSYLRAKEKIDNFNEKEKLNRFVKQEKASSSFDFIKNQKS
jgi:hypothetical protein